MKKYFLPTILATVAALAVRVTLFTDDCNLLVMGATWLAFLLVFFCLGWIGRHLSR